MGNIIGIVFGKENASWQRIGGLVERVNEHIRRAHAALVGMDYRGRQHFMREQHGEHLHPII